MKACTKQELAYAAGVSYSTFRRWMQKNRFALSRLGVTDGCRVLPQRAVKWICAQYGIDEPHP